MLSKVSLRIKRIFERFKTGYANWKKWLYGNSVEDYHDFSWVTGKKLILHIVNPYDNRAGCGLIPHINYEYQLIVRGELPTKAIHAPFQWVQVPLQGVKESDTQDLHEALYWSKDGRRYGGNACFYTKNADLVGEFLKEYSIDAVEYPAELLKVLSTLKLIDDMNVHSS